MALRQKYVAHVQRMLELLGDTPDVAQREAVTIMAMETRLAEASLTRVERRDPHKLVPQSRFSRFAGALAEFRLDRLP